MAGTQAVRRRAGSPADYRYTLAELRELLDVRVMSALRVELFFDEEAGNWQRRVPALPITGGGSRTREERSPL
jgi:hypothetical protein